MKLALKTSMNCVLLTRKEKEYEHNGTKGKSYMLGVECDDQIAELPCTQMAYDKAGEAGKYSQVVLYGDFDTAYKNFKVSAVEPVAKK